MHEGLWTAIMCATWFFINIFLYLHNEFCVFTLYRVASKCAPPYFSCKNYSNLIIFYGTLAFIPLRKFWTD
jgi:hypothetical protein